MSVHSPDAERAFRIFEALREEERNPPCCEFVEGQILHPGLDTSPCCERCSFQLLKKKRSRSNVYVCRQHARVHRCGLECKQKILSHEDWSCPWTGEVIEQSLFGEEAGSNQSRTRNNSVSQASYQGEDKSSERERKKQERDLEALGEVCDVCSEAIESSGWTKEGFLAALRHYFVFIKKNTVNFLDHVSCLLFHTAHTKFYDFDVKTIFADHNIVTRKTVLQFGLACAYLHRRGFELKGQVLFCRSDAFNDNLPKTHALLAKKYKVRAITRQQDLLKSFLKTAVDKGAEGNWAFPCPPEPGVLKT